MRNSFLQSECWEKFQKARGFDAFRVDGKLLIKYPLLLGQSYLYSPRPYFETQKELNDFIQKAIILAKEQKAFFLRFEPTYSDKFSFERLRFKKVKARLPEDSLYLDLNLSEEQILDLMKAKTRYNIRLAQKKGVKVRISSKLSDMKIFYELAKFTAKRDKIRFYDFEYFKNLLDCFGKKEILKIYVANFNGKDIASIIILNHYKKSIYLYGASGNEFRNVMAPYLLQWRAICDARKQGFRWYDFWGVAPLKEQEQVFYIKDEKHSWQGITKFKLGFAPTSKSGKYVTYPGCFEISIGKKRYFLYSMFKKVM